LGGRAELIADLGAGAEAGEFFRSRPFLDAEGATHTLRVESEGTLLALAVIVREIPAAGRTDAASLYGYPGATLLAAGAPVDPVAVDWNATGLVSLFARERLGADPSLAEATVRSMVQVHDPSRPPGVRPRLLEQIRQNERRGYEVERSPGPESTPEDRRAFHTLYTETMHRADAAERYFFAPEYFDRILEFERSWLLCARKGGGDTAAGAVIAVSDGLLHYYLGGTADAHLADSPFKNVVHAMMALADELALPLNLGGGVRPGDGLEDFKRGFANSELPFYTHEIVCDPDAYRALSGGVESTGFFPAYRA
jgi:hypothetical protein